MGYDTDYKLNVYPYELKNEVKDELGKISNYHGQLFDGFCQWYDNEYDCELISLRFPNVLISIFGFGEDRGDIWRKDYLNGELVDFWQIADVLKPEQEWIDKAMTYEQYQDHVCKMSDKDYEEEYRRKRISQLRQELDRLESTK